MSPEKLAARLRSIASKLDRSQEPSISTVLGDLSKLTEEIQSDSYAVEARNQGVVVGRSRRPTTIVIDVTQGENYDRTMKGFQKRASQK